MSQDSFSPGVDVTQAAALTGRAHNYQLSSDLARLCLPQSYRDETMLLAWVNSVCILFLAIGLVGLNPPKIIQRPLSEIVDTMPVELFTPPEEQREPQQVASDDTEPPPDNAEISDQPVVPTVVVANPASVAFPVPVKGPVLVTTSAKFASPPPANLTAPVPRPTTFNPRIATGGYYPDPPYPRTELQARHQGKVMLYVIVDPSGVPSSVTVQDSSGWPGLDKHAADWVKNRWRFPPGETRHYLVPFIFQIQ